MALVEPDGRFRRLAQVLGIRTVAHDAVMHVRTPRVVGCPPDNGQMVRGQLELWPFGDLDALGSLGRRKYLSGRRVGREQAAHRGRDRQCQKQSIHGDTPLMASLGRAAPLVVQPCEFDECHSEERSDEESRFRRDAERFFASAMLRLRMTYSSASGGLSTRKSMGG